LTPAQTQAFVDTYSNGQNASTIPANFNSDSLFAYALGIGNVPNPNGGPTAGADGRNYALGEDGLWHVVP
jgi:hypothetical protein